MKKILYFLIIICNVASKETCCQNNLDQATSSILDNVAQLKKNLMPLQEKHNNQPNQIPAEQIQYILTAQKLSGNPNFLEHIAIRKSAHQKLEFFATWFQQATIDDWINYFAIHNQTVASLSKELEALKECPDLCKEIGEKIITILDEVMKNLWEEKICNQEGTTRLEALTSLIYVQQDYRNLFKNFLQ